MKRAPTTPTPRTIMPNIASHCGTPRVHFAGTVSAVPVAKGVDRISRSICPPISERKTANRYTRYLISNVPLDEYMGPEGG